MDLLFDAWPIYSLVLAAVAVNVLFAYAAYATLATGLLSFAGIGFGAVAGLLAARLLQAGFAVPLALLAGLAAGLVLALGFGALALRLSSVGVALASLVLVLAVHALALHLPPAVLLAPPLSPALAIVAAALAGLGFYALDASWHGTAARLLRHDPALAASMGVVAWRVRLVGFAASGLAGGLGGVMLAAGAHAVSAQSFFLHLLFLASAAALLGGVAHWSGPLLGAIAVGALALLAGLLGPGLDDAAIAVAMLLVLWLRPGGLSQPTQPSVLRARPRGPQPVQRVRYHRVDR